jgi:hypothetical protein
MSDMAARQQVFSQSKMKPEFDTARIVVRESRDSELNPLSTPVILGVDVTGSMGFIAEKIAIEGLGKLIGGILDRKPVTDPHIMVMGIGDAFSDEAPLQATQFETDIRIAEQLKDIWLEARGGGNCFESYDLPWYFAATKTSIDSFEKRQKKGYLFTIGDEPPPPVGTVMDAQLLNRIVGNAERSYTSAEMLKMAQEKYLVFHVIVEEGSYARRSKDQVFSQWSNLLGRYVIRLSDHNYISEVILSVMEIAEGADPYEVADSWEKPEIIAAVRHAVNI